MHDEPPRLRGKHTFHSEIILEIHRFFTRLGGVDGKEEQGVEADESSAMLGNRVEDKKKICSSGLGKGGGVISYEGGDGCRR